MRPRDYFYVFIVCSASFAVLVLCAWFAVQIARLAR